MTDHDRAHEASHHVVSFEHYQELKASYLRRLRAHRVESAVAAAEGRPAEPMERDYQGYRGDVY